MRPKGLRNTGSRSGVSAVVAIILLVGITVVLTAFLYIIVSDLAQTPQDIPPRILLTNTGNPAGEADFVVSTGGESPRLLAEFELRLWIDGQLDPPSVMDPIAVGTIGNLTFGDFDGGGTMTDGDTIVVRTAALHSYKLILLWKGHLVHNTEWQT